MRLILLLLLVTVNRYNVLGQRECCEEYCFGEDQRKSQTAHFSTKTTYQIIKGPDFSNQLHVFECNATKIWILSRHGPRFPSAKTIQDITQLESLRDRIVENYEIKRSQPTTGYLCPVDKHSIKTWRPANLSPDLANILTNQGVLDMKSLAKFYKRNYPIILNGTYDDATKDFFHFRYTNTQRTEASFKAFAEALFTIDSNKINLPPNPERDTLLRPYDFCPLWKEQNEEEDNPASEIYKFEHSNLMNETIHSISRRLGFKYDLERKEIELMWDMCRYEQAWHPDRNSAWCVVFTPAEVTILEYAEDLKYYYKSGPSSDLNARIACHLAQDMLKNLDNNGNPKLTAYFTHSSAIQLFFTRLELFKDNNPMKADNYDIMINRQWKTSEIGPFSTNFAAIKYECPSDSKERDKVMFVLNQKPILLEGCKVGLCYWSDIKNKYENLLNTDCENTFCDLNSIGRIQISAVLIILQIMYLRFIN